MAPGDMTRDQLIEIVDKIMRRDPPDEDEQDRLLWLFENNVLHPRASSFIYFPEHELRPDYEGRSLTPEEVVDHVLAYKPIELGPAESTLAHRATSSSARSGGSRRCAADRVGSRDRTEAACSPGRHTVALARRHG